MKPTMNQEGVGLDRAAWDRLLRVAVALAAEVYVLRDRQRILEELLRARGALSREEIENYKLPPEEEAELLKERERFMARIFQGLSGGPGKGS